MQSETATVLLEYLDSIHDGGAPAHGSSPSLVEHY